MSETIPNSFSNDDPVDDRELSTKPEPSETEMRLRAFEDEHLGADATRVNGAPEDGHGSRFAGLSDAHKAHRTALMHLMAMEKRAAKARADAIEAEQALAAAFEAADHTEVKLP